MTVYRSFTAVRIDRCGCPDWPLSECRPCLPTRVLARFLSLPRGPAFDRVLIRLQAWFLVAICHCGVRLLVAICHFVTAWQNATIFYALRLEKWSQNATLQERGKSRPFVTWDSLKNGREMLRCRREAFLDRFIGESPEKMVAKCLAVAAWHFATKIASERAAPVSGRASTLAHSRFRRGACRPARAASLKPVLAVPSVYAADLGESTRLEVSGWIVIVWKRFAMYSLSKCSA